MQALIKNYRGIASAELNISKLCLIAGPNEAGKTSTAQAVAAALTGDAVPIHGVKKTGAGMLVRSGTASGSIELTGAKGTTKVVWPSAKVSSEGSGPFASHFAAGMVSIVNMEDKERIKTLTEYLKATPTRADLDKQLAEMSLTPEVLDQLWKLIEMQGWDSAHMQIKDKGTKLKGQWEGYTGEKYGSKKAESWIPDGYEPELESQSEATLKALVTDAQDALEAAIASSAVQDFKTDELEALAALQDERRQVLDAAMAVTVSHEQLEAAQYVVRETEVERTAAAERLRNLPTAYEAAGTPCPSCGVVLEVSGRSLAVLATISPEEKKAREEVIAHATAELNQIQARLEKEKEAVIAEQEAVRSAEQDARAAVNDAKRILAESQEAAEKLKTIKPATGEAGDVERFRTVLDAAKLRLDAFQKKYAADRTHQAVCQNQILIDKIAPEGIRGDVLAAALKRFNELALPITKAAGWRTVALEPDFTATYGGTLYLLLSESAKWRVRVVLQMVMAQLDRSEALIIDAADILDKSGRNGLFKAVHIMNMPCLICMTMDNMESVPNLAKAGIGVSYWLDGAEALRILP